jgi:hypothetical protein
MCLRFFLSPTARHARSGILVRSSRCGARSLQRVRGPCFSRHSGLFFRSPRQVPLPSRACSLLWESLQHRSDLRVNHGFLWYVLAGFRRVIPVIQSDANDFAGTAHWRPETDRGVDSGRVRNVLLRPTSQSFYAASAKESFVVGHSTRLKRPHVSHRLEAGSDFRCRVHRIELASLAAIPHRTLYLIHGALNSQGDSLVRHSRFQSLKYFAAEAHSAGHFWRSQYKVLRPL